MKTDEIRSSYLEFFEAREARVVPSDSLVPSNDPTLLFTGAGMNQFKDYFLGIGKMDFRRATSCQKCLRTGDIMNVGVTPSHHTMFEMLGNFSFGDYFKRETIFWAWEYLAGALKIPERLLQVSIHHTDDDAFAIWHEEIGLPAERITRLGDHDNFWPADAPKLGPNGPCGPCSEIFYDRGEGYGPDNGITGEGYRWVEIWNLVFTQYDRQPDGALEELPQKNIDTGMGLERMASCLQGTATNMDIDIFRPLVEAIAEMGGVKYGGDPQKDILMRRVADHARGVIFCIGDGVLPGNTHRGYVLKRLLRRAVLDGRTVGIREAFLHTLTPMVAAVMKQPYPEVSERADTIAETIRLEEEKFLATLEKGLTLIDMAVEKAKTEQQTRLDGATAFDLYDTYGFPYELAEEVVQQHGLAIDREGFDEAMTAARERARAGAKMKGDVFAKGPVTEVKKLIGETEFLGYEMLEAPGKVVALVVGEELVGQAEAGSEVTVILDQTPFYGESGGQVGDTGILVGPGNLVVEIEDTQKVDNISFHIGKVESGRIDADMEVTARVDAQRRLDIRRNHTVTHLLHHALRQVLGARAQQKGSYVAPDRLRFDFQHGQALTPEALRRVEDLVNQKILEDASVTTRVTDLQSAREAGATALFGEKYGETVRMVRIDDFSTELCGGTHIDHTAKIGSFRIVTEESIASGVRRIEGVTGAAAIRLSRQQGEMLSALSAELKTPVDELQQRVHAILEEERRLRKELQAAKAEAVNARLDEVEPADLRDIRYVALELAGVMGKDLAAAADVLKRKLGDEGVVVLAGSDGEKVSIVISVGPALAPKRLKAGDLVKQLAPIVGGGGGGRPEMAQAGGKRPEKIEEMLREVPRILGKALG